MLLKHGWETDDWGHCFFQLRGNSGELFVPIDHASSVGFACS